MSTSPLQALSLVIDRAGVTSADHGSRRHSAIYQAAFQLWRDEYETWKKLHQLGLDSAADCAWDRRCAAAELTEILGIAM